MVDRKVDKDNDRNCIKMFWRKCLPNQLCRYIFLHDNFLPLTQIEITDQKANTIVKEFLKRQPDEIYSLKKCLADNAKVIQYLYATLFPKYYSRNDKFAIQNKSLFDIGYREWVFNTTLDLSMEPTLMR